MNQYFYEDQVYTVDKKGSVKFGLVVENEVKIDMFFTFPPGIFRTLFLHLSKDQFFAFPYR